LSSKCTYMSVQRLLEECETKYLNASHWLISSVNNFYIGVGFNPFTVATLSTVAVTLYNVAAFSICCNTLQSGSNYQRYCLHSTGSK
jgi:hypothetical protein